MPLSLLAIVLTFVNGADSEILRQAGEAWRKGEREKALELANKAVADEPKTALPYFIRGQMHEAMGKTTEAISDFSRCLKLDPEKLPEAYDHRGSERFKAGDVAGSVADFDEFLKRVPQAAPGHWKRGISLYYVGKFVEGKKQFEGYQTTDANDVENGVWHFLCNARAVGIARARGEMLKIGKDVRVPMMEVYELYKGNAKPADVLAAAEGGNPPQDKKKSQLFYAHLYLGLYHDVLGDPKKALEHLTLAAEKYRIGHYMGDVARVHENLLRKKLSTR